MWDLIVSVPDPSGEGGGGQKGHMPPPPPPKRPQGIPCPQKKKLNIDLMTLKASCKKRYQCELLILIQYLRDYRV